MGVFFDQGMEKDCELEHSPHKAVVRLLSVGTGWGGGGGGGAGEGGCVLASAAQAPQSRALSSASARRRLGLRCVRGASVELRPVAWPFHAACEASPRDTLCASETAKHERSALVCFTVT